MQLESNSNCFLFKLIRIILLSTNIERIIRRIEFSNRDRFFVPKKILSELKWRLIDRNEALIERSCRLQFEPRERPLSREIPRDRLVKIFAYAEESSDRDVSSVPTESILVISDRRAPSIRQRNSSRCGHRSDVSRPVHFYTLTNLHPLDKNYQRCSPSPSLFIRLLFPSIRRLRTGCACVSSSLSPSFSLFLLLLFSHQEYGTELVGCFYLRTLTRASKTRGERGARGRNYEWEICFNGSKVGIVARPFGGSSLPYLSLSLSLYRSSYRVITKGNE